MINWLDIMTDQYVQSLALSVFSGLCFGLGGGYAIGLKTAARRIRKAQAAKYIKDLRKGD